MGENLIDKAANYFESAYGAPPEAAICAPGRVNIIGEHTDYLGGLCMPMAVGLSLYVCAARSDGGVSVCSESFPGEPPEIVTSDSAGKYSRISALLAELNASEIEFGGVRLSVSGDLPAGAGLSSSAALTLGSLSAICALYGLKLSGEEKIRLAIVAEHKAGTPCGYMDPAAVLHAKSGHALYLDCYHEEFEYVEIPAGDYSFYIVYSGKARDLSDGRYERLKNSMMKASSSLSALDERLTHPRFLDMLNYLEGRESVAEEHRPFLDHFYLENERVKSVRRAFEYGNIWQAGNILYDAHESMKTQLGAGSPETDWLVDKLSESRDVLGARVTGAGFGGSVIALMKKQTAPLILDSLMEEGRRRYWSEMKWYEAAPSSGLERLI